MTTEDIIRLGDATGTFIRGESGQAVFAEIARRYFAEFKSAATPEAAQAAWAKARALDDLKIALQAIADAGTFERHRRAKEEATRNREKRS